MAVGGTLLKRQKRFLRLDFLNRGGRSARGVRGNSSPMFGSPRGGAREGVRTASPKDPKGVGAYRARPWVGRGEYLGAPGGAHGKGCEQQPPDRREGGLQLAPLGGAGRIFGSPRGGAREGVRTASPYSPEGLQGLTGRAPGWGGGKLQQARLLCPRITGAKGVKLVDMRY